jgi:hypothetical protein
MTFQIPKSEHFSVDVNIRIMKGLAKKSKQNDAKWNEEVILFHMLRGEKLFQRA